MGNKAWWGSCRFMKVHPTAWNQNEGVVQYTNDSSTVEYVREGYVGIGAPTADFENDEVIAHVLQEELSQAAKVDADRRAACSSCSTAEDATSDCKRLLHRLDLYEQDELKILGDGNCQFRSLSDQLYRSPEFHKAVRQQVVDQLNAHPELYAPYLSMPYHEYITKISKLCEWGDHVTLQAAADSYGVRIFVLTSYRDTCYIEILPRLQKSERVIYLSFRAAEVHYNSIYPRGELKRHKGGSTRKKKWWKWKT